MDILLIGATGYFGGTVGEHLSQAGHTIMGAARNDLAAQRVKEAGYRPVRADVAQPGSLVGPAQQAEAVMWTATTNDGATDAAAVSATVEALADSAKPFLYISGVWDNGGSGGALISPPCWWGPRARAKRGPRWDRSSMRACSTSGPRRPRPASCSAGDPIGLVSWTT